MAVGWHEVRVRVARGQGTSSGLGWHELTLAPNLGASQVARLVARAEACMRACSDAQPYCCTVQLARLPCDRCVQVRVRVRVRVGLGLGLGL